MWNSMCVNFRDVHIGFIIVTNSFLYLLKHYVKIREFERLCINKTKMQDYDRFTCIK